MNEHRYILEPYNGMKTRYRCPECNDSDKTFVRYIDTETGEHLAGHVGRCNRESNCGYHYTPKQYFQDSGGLNNGNKIEFCEQYARTRARAKPQPKPVSFIDTEAFKRSLQSYEANHFVKFLFALFGAEITTRLIETYFIGTSKHWPGATVFWQIDQQGKARTGKIMLYDAIKGRRVKEPFDYITWVHKAIKQPEFHLKQCLFGEHLLQSNTKPVAVVESEKTALIASVYLPQFIWLAFGGLSNFNAEKCSVLNGRTITLFPDLNGFEKWSGKAKELSPGVRFLISDLLERKATQAERNQGLDIADYLIRFDYREFVLPENLTKPNIEKLTNANIEPPPTVQAKNAFAVIDSNLQLPVDELETYFESITLPTAPVKLNQCTMITDVSKFIKSHLATVKANNNRQTFLPYLNRLQELKQWLTTNLKLI